MVAIFKSCLIGRCPPRPADAALRLASQREEDITRKLSWSHYRPDAPELVKAAIEGTLPHRMGGGPAGSIFQPNGHACAKDSASPLNNSPRLPQGKPFDSDASRRSSTSASYCRSLSD